MIDALKKYNNPHFQRPEPKLDLIDYTLYHELSVWDDPELRKEENIEHLIQEIDSAVVLMETILRYFMILRYKKETGAEIEDIRLNKSLTG